mmetsp:Transcript_3660/g.4078  ORF Transcript_3660/g.4078 Transcript_3660/m.4078 type:complete len:80 (+) Transcript_3660:109-348(+)
MRNNRSMKIDRRGAMKRTGTKIIMAEKSMKFWVFELFLLSSSLRMTDNDEIIVFIRSLLCFTDQRASLTGFSLHYDILK